MMIQFFVKRLKDTFDFGKIHHPASMRIDRTIEMQFDPERMAMQARTFVAHGNIRQAVGGFEGKNLENIQGDERDIIIISTTYGRKPSGKFVQSFGPVNHSKGYKLLNVIITRAKEKIYICNSIPEEFFMNYKDAIEQ